MCLFACSMLDCQKTRFPTFGVALSQREWCLPKQLPVPAWRGRFHSPSTPRFPYSPAPALALSDDLLILGIRSAGTQPQHPAVHFSPEIRDTKPHMRRADRCRPPGSYYQ
jgi:hypothetical protein